MKKARLLVPVSVIAAVVLLLMAPAGALAAPNTHGGGDNGWNGGWHDDQNGGWHDDENDGWDGDQNGGWDDHQNGGWDDHQNDGWHDDENGGWDDHEDCGFTYRVKCGDTIGNIAWRFGVNSTHLAQVNGLHNPNWIFAGQALWIPGGCW